MEGRCDDHVFDVAVDLCARCGGEFCVDCVVYAFGRSAMPYCRPCAVHSAGLRSRAAVRPALARRERRGLMERRRSLFAR